MKVKLTYIPPVIVENYIAILTGAFSRYFYKELIYLSFFNLIVYTGFCKLSILFISGFDIFLRVTIHQLFLKVVWYIGVFSETGAEVCFTLCDRP